MDQTEPDLEEPTCLFCKALSSLTNFFVCGPEYSGICDECVGYLMNWTAIDNVGRFERQVEVARTYAKNNDELRRTGTVSHRPLLVPVEPRRNKPKGGVS